MKVGVFGLGSMGFGMASSLIREGHEVFGADVKPEAVKRLRDAGGSETDLNAAAG
ncbi:NAD(P)-binding domain-containing protein, partial [Rhizobium ruizarguesonis]